MTALIASIKGAWEAYVALAIIIAAILGFASIPGRVDAVEQTQREHDTMLRFIVCTMGAQSRGFHPAACESHLNAGLLDYLRPPTP
jgi:hypothetical protein